MPRGGATMPTEKWAEAGGMKMKDLLISFRPKIKMV
jgi:hypothetical protein